MTTTISYDLDYVATCDYSQTVIYQLVCKDPSIVKKYIGHTTHLPSRIRSHYLNIIGTTYNNYVYQFIRNTGGWENWKCELLLNYPCEDIHQAKIKECEYITALGNDSLNVCIPTRPNSEYAKKYRKEHAEHIRIQHNQYNEAHREQVNARARAYRSKNRDKINEKNSARYAENKDEINKRRRDEYAARKDELNAKRSAKRSQKKNSIIL